MYFKNILIQGHVKVHGLDPYSSLDSDEKIKEEFSHIK